MTEISSNEAIISTIAEKIVKRGLEVPAIFFLETMKPMNFIGAQFLNFFGPFLEMLFPGEKYYEFTEAMEKRENVEKLLLEIERLSGEKKTYQEKPQAKEPGKGFFQWRK
ncbi:MAG TPA: hypothetical protein ENN84_01600 [Candidatus Marinimicrobia bacterium]|nr:hypothetical protein [Candidatus Neomarinimicrobiota bacterium]